MQSVRWYIGRLSAMSPGEILWRIKSEFLGVEERFRVATGRLPKADIDTTSLQKGFSVSTLTEQEWAVNTEHSPAAAWLTTLRKSADKVLQHKISYFDLTDQFLGEPVNWHMDHSANKLTPVIYSKKIDYRDFNKNGDCKLVWEPNRHHHLVILARACRATGEKKYASAVVQQIEHWIETNPFGKGMNWRSPLELGIRLINWVWALDLIADADVCPVSVKQRIVENIYLQCWDVSRKFSQGTSANNHLVGEAAGVYVAASYFPNMLHAKVWREQSKKILEQQIKLQTYPDGCTREQALGYEFFVIQFYVLSGLVGRWCKDEFSDEYWQTIEQLYSFVAQLSAGGKLPMFGDRDDGYVLNLGNTPDDIPANLSLAAVLFDREDFAQQAGGFTETAYWLTGSTGMDRFKKLSAKPSSQQKLQSISFADSGYYLLQYGSHGSGREVSAMLDCGELGFGAIAAHGHADALAITLRIGGDDVLVDPGTYDYFTYPQWREYFRTTRAHNTIEVDGENQSEILGPFLWGKRANAMCRKWQPTAQGGMVVGQHDGYQRLTDPVTHQRSLHLDAVQGKLQILDELTANAKHRVALHFHFAPDCSVTPTGDNMYQIQFADKSLVLELDTRFSVTEFRGSDAPIAGWFSPGYHQKRPSTTLAAVTDITTTTEFKSTLSGLPVN
ncbi:MAG: heparinase II/III family protein [Gammaproteobacteria bacterium]|nr:heparinase II/III family protein [Gammaproteobacteria bacterium]MDH5652382.1 heparinase II/III family protein [Gammaproteobacteria bacterium]